MKLTYDRKLAQEAMEENSRGITCTVLAVRLGVPARTVVRMIEQARAYAALEVAVLRVRADEPDAHVEFRAAARKLGVSVPSARQAFAAPRAEVEAALRAGERPLKVIRRFMWPAERVNEVLAEIDGDARGSSTAPATLPQIVGAVGRRGGACYLGQLITAFAPQDEERVRAGVRELVQRGVLTCEPQRVGGRPIVRVVSARAAAFRQERARAERSRAVAPTADPELLERMNTWREPSPAEVEQEAVAREQCLRGELQALHELAERVLREMLQAERARHLGLVPGLRDEGRRLAARAREVEAELGRLPARRGTRAEVAA